MLIILHNNIIYKHLFYFDFWPAAWEDALPNKSINLAACFSLLVYVIAHPSTHFNSRWCIVNWWCAYYIPTLLTNNKHQDIICSNEIGDENGVMFILVNYSGYFMECRKLSYRKLRWDKNVWITNFYMGHICNRCICIFKMRWIWWWL